MARPDGEPITAVELAESQLFMTQFLNRPSYIESDNAKYIRCNFLGRTLTSVVVERYDKRWSYTDIHGLIINPHDPQGRSSVTIMFKNNQGIIEHVRFNSGRYRTYLLWLKDDV